MSFQSGMDTLVHQNFAKSINMFACCKCCLKERRMDIHIYTWDVQYYIGRMDYIYTLDMHINIYTWKYIYTVVLMFDAI